MKFHNQMIHKIYDHTAQILYTLKSDPEFLAVHALENDRERLYRSVLNEYRHHSIEKRQIDFFYDNSYYQNAVTSISIDASLGAGMVEQNMILYHVGKIIDSVIDFLRKSRIRESIYYNIGFIGVDMSKKQLFITDIENRYVVTYQLMIDRDMKQMFGNGKEFQYHIRFRFLERKDDSTEQHI